MDKLAEESAEKLGAMLGITEEDNPDLWAEMVELVGGAAQLADKLVVMLGIPTEDNLRAAMVKSIEHGLVVNG